MPVDVDADVVRDTHPMERLLGLRRVKAFAGLSPGHLSLLAQETRERFYPAGTRLMTEGQPIRLIQVITEGEVEITRGDRLLSRFGPGESVGVWALLGRVVDTPSAVAASDVSVLTLGATRFLDLLEEHFSLYHHLVGHVNREIIALRLARTPDAGFDTDGLADKPCEIPRGRALDLVERLFFLRRIAILKSGDLEALVELARHVSEQRFAPGERLWSEGDRGTHLLLLVQGKVRCSTRAGHRFYFGDGDAPGALDAVGGVPRWYEAVTDCPTVALRMDAESLLEVLEEHPRLAAWFLTRMSATILELAADGQSMRARSGVTRSSPGPPARPAAPKG